MKDVILPLSIDEVYDCFFADDAPYFISRTANELGDKITDEGTWTTEINKEFETIYDKMTLSQRKTEAEFFLPSNPIADHGFYTKYALLGEKDPTDMVIKEVTI